MIVIGLIGILAAAFVIYLNPAYQLSKARDGNRKSDVQQIRSALELYRADCGSYPADTGNVLATPLTSNCTGNTITYMQTVPTDPKTNVRYYYDLNATGYSLRACLENTNDTDGATEVNCPAPDWAYTVTNP